MAADLQLPPDWTIHSIGDLGKVVTGKTPSTKLPDNFGGGIPFITPSDMDGRRIISHTARYLTDKGATSVSSSRIPAGAVMVSCIGSDMGKAAIAGCDAVTNQQINSIIIREGVSSTYVYYDLSTRQREIQHIGSGGSAVPILNKGHFCQLQIVLPPIKEQEAIACILGIVDDKIELNQEIRRTLEEAARAIFKSWFVNFEPSRAKAAGQKPPGLKTDIAALFPDSFADSRLGEIPKGWQVETLGDVVDALVSGGRPKGGAAKEGVPSVGAENIIGLGKYDFSKEKYVPLEFFKELQRKGSAVQPGDILLYKDGAQVGRKTYFDCGFPHAECAVNEHVLIVRARSQGYQRYLYFWLDQDWMTQEIISLNSNSAQPGINQQGVRTLPLLKAPDAVVEAYDQIVEPLTDRLFAACHESRTLAALRDTLLPKLISGELRVPDAERIVGRAV